MNISRQSIFSFCSWDVHVVYVQGDKNYAVPMTKNVNHQNMVKNFDYMADLNRFSDV